MKVEVICKNLKCPTRIDRAQPQLVKCHKLRLGNGRQIPVDEDDNPVGCPWCDMAIVIDRLSSDQAQFALGQVEIFDDIREHFGEEWLDSAKQVVAWHVGGEYGSVDDEVRKHNQEVIDLLPFVRTTDMIISQHYVEEKVIWVITKPALGTTQVLGRGSLGGHA